MATTSMGVMPVSYTHLDVYKRQLYALQHRGQESCGITVNDDGILTSYKDVGLAHEVFDQDRLLSLGKGCLLYTSRCV